MSQRAAQLFTRLQDARFYREMHETAAALIPDGAGRTWLDIGCGPGLLARMAADKGYEAVGVDRDADMIEAARTIARARHSTAVFEVADIDAITARSTRYDVVSASSLLVVLPEPAAALRQLVALTKPGGTVLIVEAARGMSRLRALSMLLSGQLGSGGGMLLAWAGARAGNTLNEDIFRDPFWTATRHPLLKGMACAWTITSSAPSITNGASYD